MSAYVTIGRKVGNVDMPPQRWTDFISRTRMAVNEFAGPLVTWGATRGEYNGVPESCYIVVGSRTPNPHETSCLRIALRNLARAYNQDCIALAIADVEFCEGE